MSRMRLARLWNCPERRLWWQLPTGQLPPHGFTWGPEIQKIQKSGGKNTWEQGGIQALSEGHSKD